MCHRSNTRAAVSLAELPAHVVHNTWLCLGAAYLSSTPAGALATDERRVVNTGDPSGQQIVTTYYSLRIAHGWQQN